MTNLEIMKSLVGQKAPKQLSPVGHWLGYTLTAVEAGDVTLELTTRPEMANPAGMVHGGMLTTISDDAMGIALYVMDHDHYFVTVDIHINFLYGIPVGSILHARGKVVRSGKKISHVTCEITDESSRLCAVASSNLVSTSASSAKEYTK